jgi:NAD-dependent deacetylase
MDDNIQKLKNLIAESENLVFFGGAGVSTESGIPDFRSVDGLYHQTYKYPPETILSHSFFESKPEEFFRYYRDKLVLRGAKPNAAHVRLAQLEKQGKLKAVVTQNIDGLHQAAGSENVLELHGSTHRCYCSRCEIPHPAGALSESFGIPRCTCGGVLRPDVVLYEEALDQDVVQKSIRFIREADVLIVGGTSLAVYPAAGLIDYYRGSKLVLINKDATGRDSDAGFLIRANIGSVFSQI